MAGWVLGRWWLEPRENAQRVGYGLEKTWLGSLVLLLVLAWPTWRYRKYKAAHPNGWARYV